MKTITLTGSNPKANVIKKHLVAWDIPFREVENALITDILLVVIDKKQTMSYTWGDINTRDKLWRIVKKEQPGKKTKLRITKITKSTTHGIDLSMESLARINVTMTRVVNGQNIIDIMNGWSDEEKAAGMIMWRLAQHQNAITMAIFAEMLNDKAKTIDPWRK